MITEEEYRALAEAFERLHDDYVNLEEEKTVKELREQYRNLQEYQKERESYWNQKYEQLEEIFQAEKVEWKKKIEDEYCEIQMLRSRQKALEQCISEKNERIEQLEYYLHHPVLNFRYLIGTGKKKGKQ